MPTNYTGNPIGVQAPSGAPGPNEPIILALPNDGEAANVASLLQPFRSLADFVAWLVSEGLRGNVGLQYGDGFLGDADITGTTTLDENPGASACYENLTIRAAGRLYPRGQIIRVRDTLTVEAGGFIQPYDAAALAGTANSGATGGPVSQGALTPTTLRGSAGGRGGDAAGSGSNGTGGTVVGGGVGGAGGGVLSGGAAGAGGSYSALDADLRRYLFGIPGMSSEWPGLAVRGLTGGTGGGGGAGAAAGGGGGGRGGDALIVFARRVILATGTDLRSPGGPGGSSSGAGGGGGGGGGGWVAGIWGSKVGADLTSACVPGGAGGSGGLGNAAPGGVGNFVEMLLG
jgi:hypothetical protein